VTGASLARASPANSSVTSGGVHAASGERFEPVTYIAQGDEDIGTMFVTIGLSCECSQSCVTTSVSVSDGA
jgi:hypothetical protein